MRSRFFSLIALSAAALPLAATGAKAAPQILGLVASAAPVPLHCADGTCTAELTTVCLQEYRAAPMPGAAYRASDQTRLTLTVAGSKPVDVTAHATFTALRNISSVRVRLPVAAVRGLGPGEAAISVGAMGAVVPMPTPGDDQPQGAYEIAAYTGAFRRVADGVFARNQTTVESLELLNQVINRLPDGLGEDTATFETVWREVVGSKPMPADVMHQTSEAADICRAEIDHGMLPSMKSCIADRHDALASETTKKVWKALEPNG